MTDERTPSTAEVRELYTDNFLFTADAGVEFDRWLESHDAEVQRAAFDEAADICERIQNDPEFHNPGPGVAAAKIVLRMKGLPS